MAINITDSGSTIQVEFTANYNAGHGVISAGIRNINKDDFDISHDGSFVIIKSSEGEWRIVYTDITTPAGASASAVRVLIEAFLDTGELFAPSSGTTFVPAYYSQTIIAAGTSAASNQSAGSNILGANYRYVGMQLNATSLSAADGVIKLQDSIDGINWSDITGATITVASGTSTNMIRDTAFTGKYIAVVWTKGTNASGTLEALLMFK